MDTSNSLFRITDSKMKIHRFHCSDGAKHLNSHGKGALIWENFTTQITR